MLLENYGMGSEGWGLSGLVLGIPLFFRLFSFWSLYDSSW